MMFCPRCGGPMYPGPMGKMYCPRCASGTGHSHPRPDRPGRPLGSLKCPRCGATIPHSTRQCPNCGYQFPTMV